MRQIRNIRAKLDSICVEFEIYAPNWTQCASNENYMRLRGLTTVNTKHLSLYRKSTFTSHSVTKITFLNKEHGGMNSL